MSQAVVREPKVCPEFTERPLHVPAELIHDVDIHDREGEKDGPHEAWKRVQKEKQPEFRVKAGTTPTGCRHGRHDLRALARLGRDRLRKRRES